ncbi:hypothetical protein DM860_002400 [Cuscuta australis]|uniref:STAS domain-containing protein n=1 Tax=Cuscuta australis TaxID=267555 RepID=A0A328CY97_9ASTE|nr:hypothetical protein DM860_002400 [Cuscuta australis]
MGAAPPRGGGDPAGETLLRSREIHRQRDAVPRRPVPEAEETAAPQKAGHGVAVFRAHTGVGPALQSPVVPVGLRRRNHHCQPRRPPGDQLCRLGQSPSRHRIILEFCATACVCGVRKFSGHGDRDGSGAVAAIGGDVGEGSQPQAQPQSLPSLGSHRHLLCRPLPSFFRHLQKILGLGMIVDYLSHATILGFMGGAATVVCLQQLKGILGLVHFTHATDFFSVLRSILTQFHQWRWESGVLGCCFLFFLLLTKYFSKKKAAFFWINAMAPLTSVILGSVLVYFTHAEKHGVQVIGELKKGINPASASELAFGSPYIGTAIKAGVITGVIALAEGIAVGRSFAMFKNYHIDGNKEMIAFGIMNIAGSCTSCYLTTAPFSRTAVNFNAGCKTAVSNIVMAVTVMMTLLFLTPLFYYTPLVVLSSIIISAMLGVIDYQAAIHLWKLDKFDFLVCISAYIGVIFGSIEIGLVVAVALSMLRVLLFVARPKTMILGNVLNSGTYRSVDQYPKAATVPGILIIHIGAPIYFANAGYLRERIFRWIDEEEEKIDNMSGTELQYVVLDLSAVGNVDTSGISMLDEVKKELDLRNLKLVLANPGGEMMKKLEKSMLMESIGKEWIYLTVAEAVNTCNYILHTCKPPKAAATTTTATTEIAAAAYDNV